MSIKQLSQSFHVKMFFYKVMRKALRGGKALLVIPTCKRNRLKGEAAVVVAVVDTPKRAHKHNAEKKKNSHTCIVEGSPSSWRSNAQGNVVHVDGRGMSHLGFTIAK